MIPDIETSLVVMLIKASLRDGIATTLPIISNSMAPILRRGDKIEIVNVQSTDLNRGQIIVFQVGDDLLAHRFWGHSVESGQTALITKGDRLNIFDPPVLESQLVGLVSKRWRGTTSLPLDRGQGRWLNRQLMLLASLEASILGSKPLSDRSYTGKHPEREPSFDKPALLRRFVAYCLYRLAVMLNAVISLLPTTNQDKRVNTQSEG